MPQLSGNPEQFLRWFHTQYKSAPFKQSVAVAGVAVGGIIACYSAFPLGEGFGTLAANLFKANSMGTSALEWLFGIGAYVPTATLVSFPVYYKFKELGSHLACETQLPTRTDYKASRMAGMGLSHVFAVVAGIPFFGLMQPYAQGIPVFSVVFPGTALLGSYMATRGVQEELVEDTFVHYANPSEPERVKSARARLTGLVTQSIKELQRMSADNIHHYAEIVKTRLDPKHFAEDQVLGIINTLLGDIPFQAVDLESQAAAAPATKTWTKRFVDLGSEALGVAANYVLYGVTKSVMDGFLTWAGMPEGMAYEAIGGTISVLATMSNMYFNAIFAQRDAEYIYDSVNRGNRVPGLKSSAAHIVSALSALPQTVVAVRAATSNAEEAIVAPTFVGTTMARALAFMMLIDLVIHTWNKNSADAKRQNLLGMTRTLQRSIAMLESTELLALESALDLEPTPVQSRQPTPLTIQVPAIEIADAPLSAPLPDKTVKTPIKKSNTLPSLFAIRDRVSSPAELRHADDSDPSLVLYRNQGP